jgi:hypothetical protein
MSDSILRLIPDAPGYVPRADQISVVISILSRVTPEAVVHADVYPEVKFVDQGGNFEAIYCPCCADELDLVWWGQAMDQAAQTQFADLAVITPCCGCRTSLNDLKYHWPAGFARFCITINNPPPDIADSTIQALNDALSTTLRKIWVHY